MAKLQRGEHFEGFNNYGKELSRVFFQWRSDTISTPVKWFKVLCERVVFKSEYANTVLLVSDSYAKYVTNVEGGDVKRLPGGRYPDMVGLIEDARIDPKKYRFVIINCGFNCATPRHDDPKEYRDGAIIDFWYTLWYPLKQLLLTLSTIGYLSVIVNSGMSLPKARGDIAAHTRYIKKEFVKDFGDNERFHFLDWSSPHSTPSDPTNNPFFTHPNSLNLDLFDIKKERGYDYVHLNHRGFHVFWRHWAEVFPDLKNVAYTVSDNPYAYPPANNERYRFPVFRVA